MPASYFVYYRVAPEQEVRAMGCVEALLESVAAATGVQGRLLKKRDEPLLWMEVFEKVLLVAEFERALAHAVSHSGIEHALAAASGRKVECFLE